MKRPLAVYIHWPYCLSKCPYCDFASRPVPAALDEAEWAKAYRADMRRYARRLGDREITSVYFGGGTPSLMPPSLAQHVLSSLSGLWPFAPACEITLEANPAAAMAERLRAFRAAGVNRLSLGVQAFDDERLQFLGRAHDAATAVQALEAAASLFERFSFDLMYGFAGQSEEAWRETLARALSFAPKHLSLYQLTIEPRTPFFKRAQTEELAADDEQAARLYELTQEELSAAGLPAYEVSNHAATGEESRHNLAYWRYQEYIGLGPSAHGRFVEGQDRWATEAPEQSADWMAAAQADSTDGFSRLSPVEARQEALMMGLRLSEGVSKARWRALFGETIESFLDSAKIAALTQEGLIADTPDALVATGMGRQKLNALCAYLF